MRGDLVSCVLYTKAVARLPLRYLGFLVNSGDVVQLIKCDRYTPPTEGSSVHDETDVRCG